MHRTNQSVFFLALNISVLIAMLTGCAAAAPVPTATTVPSTAVPTLVPTPTTEPSATPASTEVPMPEGWTAIAETREIGSRQVVINEKGDAASEVDGVFYPVDAKGCFYKELFDPELQKNDPKIMELMETINNEASFVFGGTKNGDGDLWPRHASGSIVGFLRSGVKLPVYRESTMDGIISNQQLCFNAQTGEWEHVLDYVLASNVKVTPEDSLMMRVVVGWLRDGKYKSFTYRQEAKTFEGRDISPTVSGSGIKAGTAADAFELWRELIESKEQIGVNIPNKLFAVTGVDLEAAIRDLPGPKESKLTDNLSDPEFLEWVVRDDNQVAYFSDKQHTNDLYVTNAARMWRYWGEQAAEGVIPEPVARTITIEKR